MRKIHQKIVFVVLFLVLNHSRPWHSSAEELIKTDKALRKIFPSATHFDSQSLILSEAQIKDIEAGAKIRFGESHSSTIQKYTARENGDILGYAFEDIVVGKWGPIHYLVGLDVSGTIVQVIVLDYQEIRGKPIAKKRFLRQYKKKNINDPIKLRRDIDGVTGATISSRSITNGIRKLLYISENIIVE